MDKKINETSSKTFPTLWEQKENCCGCTACYAICPVSAIYMEEDEEGFEYPHIKTDLCIKCYMCQKVCPIKNDKNKYLNKTLN